MTDDLSVDVASQHHEYADFPDALEVVPRRLEDREWANVASHKRKRGRMSPSGPADHQVSPSKVNAQEAPESFRPMRLL